MLACFLKTFHKFLGRKLFLCDPNDITVVERYPWASTTSRILFLLGGGGINEIDENTSCYSPGMFSWLYPHRLSYKWNNIPSFVCPQPEGPTGITRQLEHSTFRLKDGVMWELPGHYLASHLLENKERMKIFEVFQFPSHVIKINKIREMSFSYFSSPKLFPQFILKYKYIF